jgi:ArsR family transcriptional regulator
VDQPLHRFKAELFKTLGSPLRIKILELLRDGDITVADMLQRLEVEPSTASQQLAVLRAHGIVEGQREGTTVRYRLRDPLVIELLDVARRLFNNRVLDLQQLLAAQERVELGGTRQRRGRERPVGASS